jgi:hypothetical protein
MTGHTMTTASPYRKSYSGGMKSSQPYGSDRQLACLYALPTEFALQLGASDFEVFATMWGTLLEGAELMGTYAKVGQKSA